MANDYIVPAIEPPMMGGGAQSPQPIAAPAQKIARQPAPRQQEDTDIGSLIPGLTEPSKKEGKAAPQGDMDIGSLIPGLVEPQSKSVAQMKSIQGAVASANTKSEWDDNSPLPNMGRGASGSWGDDATQADSEDHTHDSMMQKMQNPEYWQSLAMSADNGLGHVGGAVAQALLHSGVDVPDEWKKAVDQSLTKNNIKDEALRAKVGRSGMNIPKIAGEAAPFIAAAMGSGGTAIPEELGVLGLMRTGAVAGAQNSAITPEENAPIDNAEFWKQKAWNMLKGAGAGAVVGPVAGKAVPVAGKLANDLTGGTLGTAAQAMAPKSVANAMGQASTPSVEESVTNSAIKHFIINNLHRISPTAGAAAKLSDALGLLGGKAAPTAESVLKKQAQSVSAKAGGIVASGSEAKDAKEKTYKKASEIVTGMKEKHANQD